MKKQVLLPILFLAVPFICISNMDVQGQSLDKQDAEWISLFNGQNLNGWFVRGKAKWSVEDGVLVGKGGMGHIYAEPVLSDLEVKGKFRISKGGNSGLYFRCHPPEDNPDGFPRVVFVRQHNG